MTLTNNSADLVPLKTDALGRVQTPREDREALLDLFEQSGLSGAAFARGHGLNYPTFASWRQARRKRREQAAEQRDAPSGFQEVLLEPQAGCEGLHLELPCGARLQVRTPLEAALAAALLRELGAARC